MEHFFSRRAKDPIGFYNTTEMLSGCECRLKLRTLLFHPRYSLHNGNDGKSVRSLGELISF